MHILILSSVWPILSHEHAAKTVLGNLLLTLLEKGNRVSFAIAYPNETPNQKCMDVLETAGLNFVGDFTSEMDMEDPVSSPSRLKRWKNHAHCLLSPQTQDDYPRFINSENSARHLEEVGADVALLFWDSWFEYLLGSFENLPVVGYLARPRTEAGLARTSEKVRGIKRWLEFKTFDAQKKRHLNRLQHLSDAANICAIDAAWYRENNIECSYIPNTWPDAFGQDAWSMRQAAQSHRDKINILGNIGHVSATGNSYGISYTASQVMPYLEGKLTDIDWVINICGGGTPRPEVHQLLDHPRIAVKGFVDDIDDEVLSNEVFLLCNNAGPYTGGYTRVMYVMSSAGCLIAHRNLALSMPELVHNENCLLGDTAEEIADHINSAASDAQLRERIGIQARHTYDTRYAPGMVVDELIKRCQAIT